MGLALAHAAEAGGWGDVPIGCVVVRQGVVVAQAANAREHRGDPTAHAEILALREAATAVGGWRLEGCTIYVTLEPCAMCAGAIVLARLDRLVYGATDPKAGAVESLYNIVQDRRLNHRVSVLGGVRADDCASLLRRFFTERRRPPG